jgi:hypothetical protein
MHFPEKLSCPLPRVCVCVCAFRADLTSLIPRKFEVSAKASACCSHRNSKKLSKAAMHGLSRFAASYACLSLCLTLLVPKSHPESSSHTEFFKARITSPRILTKSSVVSRMGSRLSSHSSQTSAFVVTVTNSHNSMQKYKQKCVA